MNTVKIAVLNGGKVSQVLELEPGRAPHTVTVRAAKGSRFVVMDSDGEPTPQPIQTRRIGRNLLVDLDSEGVGLPTLIIEDFHAMQAELIGKDDDGTYHAYVQPEDADLDAADLLDGGDTELVLAAGPIAGGGALAEALSGAGAGAAAGLSGLAWAGLAGLGAAGIGTVVTRSGNKGSISTDSTNTGDTPAGGAPGPDKAPVLVGMHDDVGAQQGLINAGDITDDTTPTFNGTGTPGNTVEILDGGTLIGTAVVQADGQWSWTPVTPLAEGAHSVAFREVDGAGNASPDSPGFDFVVDITAPGTPSFGIGNIQDDSTGTRQPIGSGGHTRCTAPVFNGDGQEPGDRVILRDSKTGVTIGEAIVAADGSWEIIPGTALAEGEHTFELVIEDKAGNQSAPSAPVTVIVDITAPDAPSFGIGNIQDNSAGTPQLIGSEGHTKDTTPAFTGNGQESGDRVILRDSNTGVTIGEAIVAADGSWEIIPGTELAEGEHTFELVIEDKAGNQSAPSAPVTVIVDITAPDAPSFGIGNILDNSPGTPQLIGTEAHTNNTTPVFNGDGQEPGDKVILRDKNTGVSIGEAIVGADGTWEIIPGTALAHGSHMLELVSEDKAGNQSAPSDPLTVVVDSVAPTATVSIESITKDSGNDNDFRTNDGSAGRTVEGRITGTLSSGERVMVSVDGGHTWQAATINGDRWSMVDNSMHSGSWQIQARVVDLAGNAGESCSQDVVLDTAVSPLTSISLSGDVIHLEFDGGDLGPGSVIVMRVDGVEYRHEITSDELAAGRVELDWSVVGGAAIDGISMAIVDEAGNESVSRSLVKDVNGGRVEESFDGLGFQSFFGGDTFELNGFSMRVIDDGTVYGDLGGIYPAIGGQAGSSDLSDKVISLASSMHLELEFDAPKSGVTFKAGELSGGLRLVFHDKDGVVVHEGVLGAGHVSGDLATYELPYGMSFTMVSIAMVNSSWDAVAWLHDVAAYEVGYVLSDITPGDGAPECVPDLGDIAVQPGVVEELMGHDGADSLRLTGADQVVDLSVVAGKLPSAEVIDVTGIGDNTLKLSLDDVLQHGGKDLFIADGSTRMMIKGDAGDSVELSDLVDGLDNGDWAQQSGTVTVEGAQYAVYVHSGSNAELLVQSGVQVHLDSH